VFENRVLRKTFGPKREEDGSWRKLHNDELRRRYSSPSGMSEVGAKCVQVFSWDARKEETTGKT
jgi:hypothetical protein